MDLYANEFTTFWKVTFPLILPGIIAAGLLAFSLSIDDFVVTNFTAGKAQTFPMFIYAKNRIGDPGTGQRDRHDHLRGRRRLRRPQHASGSSSRRQVRDTP